MSARWQKRDGGILIARQPGAVFGRKPYPVGRVIIFGSSQRWVERKDFFAGASMILGHFLTGQRINPTVAESGGCTIPAGAVVFVQVEHNLPKYRSGPRHSGDTSHRRVVGSPHPDAHCP